MKNNTLLVISVPFGRNARFLLSSEIYKKMIKKYDILIVSPFSNNSNLKKEFGGANIYFLSINSQRNKHKYIKYLYSLSELLRFNGYWFRFRKDKWESLWRLTTSLKVEQLTRKYIKKSIRDKIITYLTGYLGYFKFTWRLIDRIFGRYFYNINTIFKYTSKYRNVIIIQTANFSFQERFLSFFARKFSYKSIFVPYTTDQLMSNGYLINNFESICAQGPIETGYLIKYHNIPPKKIFKLGMLWFRNIETLNTQINQNQKKDKYLKKRILLYAGSTMPYFSKQIELQAIDKILSAIKKGLLPNAKLIYRPIANKNELKNIFKKYSKKNEIEIQIPQYSLMGMEQYTKSSIKEDIIEYLKMMSSIDICIMSNITTLLFEAIYFGKPVISYFAGSNSGIPMTGYDELLIKEDIAKYFSSGIPAILSSSDILVEKIKEILDNPSWYHSMQKKLLNHWDYKNPNYISEFMKLIKSLEP